MSHRTVWFFDGHRLYAPIGVVSAANKTSWKATSGGRPGPQNNLNVEMKSGASFYRPLPNGNYRLLIKEGKYTHPWYRKDAKGGMEEVPRTEGTDNDHEKSGGYMRGVIPSMQDAKNNNWFIAMIPTDPGNYRGLLWQQNRLGIHPDGPSKGANSHRNDGTEGCIGIQEADTSDLAALFLQLVKGKLSTSDQLCVAIDQKGQKAFLQENHSTFGNRPDCVSVLMKA